MDFSRGRFAKFAARRQINESFRSSGGARAIDLARAARVNSIFVSQHSGRIMIASVALFGSGRND